MPKDGAGSAKKNRKQARGGKHDAVSSFEDFMRDRPALAPELYINRELSWLEFNRRVLDEAAEPDMPLLARARFAAIFASNLDEFFMIRVAGVKRKVKSGSLAGPGRSRVFPARRSRCHGSPGRWVKYTLLVARGSSFSAARTQAGWVRKSRARPLTTASPAGSPPPRSSAGFTRALQRHLAARPQPRRAFTASVEQGALRSFGTGTRPTFDRRRT